jgi:uncharacterized protein (DUF305 family)
MTVDKTLHGRLAKASTIVAIVLLGGCNGTPNPLQSATSASLPSVDRAADASHSAHSLLELGAADDRYDLRFIDAMIPHHEGAIAMAEDALKKSQNPDIKKLATAIIAAQKQEIAQMRQWRRSWYPQAPSQPVAWDKATQQTVPMSPEQIRSMRMDLNLGAADDLPLATLRERYDLRFIDGMIPHHTAAVAMAKDVAVKSKRGELQQLAKNIISAQNSEIQLLQRLRKV